MSNPLRKTLFTGTGVSTIVGIGLTGVGLLTSSKWQISALVGLVSVLVGALLTAMYAFGRRLDEIDERQIAVQPLQSLYKVPHLELPLIRIVEAVVSTHGSRSAFLTNRTTAAVEQFSKQVANMANGAFVCSSRNDEIDLVKDVLAATKREVRAVASRGMEWWLEADADVYFQAYGEETRRISVTRIFLIEKNDLEKLQPMLLRHAKAGIQTYALDLEQVQDGRRRGMVLFDNTLLHRAAPLREGINDPLDVEFTDVAEEIRRAEDDFTFLFNLARTPDRHPPATLFASEPKRAQSRIKGLRWAFGGQGR